jgi:hypothetical protein
MIHDAMAPNQTSWLSQLEMNEAPDRTRPLAARIRGQKQLATLFFIAIDFPISQHSN